MCASFLAEEDDVIWKRWRRNYRLQNGVCFIMCYYWILWVTSTKAFFVHLSSRMLPLHIEHQGENSSGMSLKIFQSPTTANYENPTHGMGFYKITSIQLRKKLCSLCVARLFITCIMPLLKARYKMMCSCWHCIYDK